MRGLIKRHGENIYQNGGFGKTSLYDGTRVRKDDPRIALNGTLDEVTCAWELLVREQLQRFPID